jgi:hypothetical protein
MPKPLNFLRRGGRAVLAGVLASLALAALGASAASVPAASASSYCAWQPLTLNTSWQSAGSDWGTGDPAFCVTGDGIVHLSGSLKEPSGGPSEFATLPSWAWPFHAVRFSVYTYGGSAEDLQIDPNGNMFTYMTLSATYPEDELYTSLAGVSFRASWSTGQNLTLLHGWASAQSSYGSADPSYSLSGGVVHLSGGLTGTQVPGGLGDQAPVFAVLPSGARPDYCTAAPVYTYDAGQTVQADPQGVMEAFGNGGTIYGTDAQHFTSLDGVAFPVAGTIWQPLTLVNGWSQHPGICATGNNGSPSYYISGGVVYLTGTLAQPIPNGNGYFAQLPPGARPTHNLYLTLSAGGQPHASLMIGQDGWMYLWGGGAGGFASLAGLSYPLGS